MYRISRSKNEGISYLLYSSTCYNFSNNSRPFHGAVYGSDKHYIEH
jgi:hypothetical protein